MLPLKRIPLVFRVSYSNKHLVMTAEQWPVSMYTTCCRALSGIRNLMSTRFLSFTKQKPKDKFTIAIEGNIGSGKTSLLHHFLNDPNAEVYKEPVDKWRNVNGQNALALMYEDPTRWSLTFQTYVQLTMLETHTKKQGKPVKLMERSIFSAKYCFVENLYRSGKMPEIEYLVLTRWFDWICQNEDVNVDLIVYLRTQPETVYERIKTRCRREEEAIPLEYLTTLHELHEDWLTKKTAFNCPAPVLVLEADQDLQSMNNIFQERRQEIMCGYS